MRWVVMKRKARTITRKVTGPGLGIWANGVVGWNAALHAEMSNPSHVEVLVNVDTMQLGVRPCNPDAENGFTVQLVKKSGSGKVRVRGINAELGLVDLDSKPVPASQREATYVAPGIWCISVADEVRANKWNPARAARKQLAEQLAGGE